MSQTSKRPGSRDISDLKARLGLKKNAGANNAAGIQPPPSVGGAAAPPEHPPADMQIPGPPSANVPAPPGIQVPAPTIVPPPGSAPIITQQIAPAYIPDIVVVNDGQPVESVASGGKGGSIGKIAIMVIFPLVAGVFIGKMASSANQHNQVIEDAARVKDDVKKVRKSLTALTAVLQSSKKAEKFSTGDMELITAIAALPEVTGQDDLLFRSALYTLDPKAVSEVYGFYTDIHTLNRQIRDHVRMSKKDAKIIKDGAVKLRGFNPIQFGAVVSIPKADKAAAGQPVTIRLVQLGAPICKGETAPSQTSCPGALAGFQHREDQTSSFRTSSLAPTGEGDWSKSPLVLLKPSKVLEQLLKGGGATVADSSYQARIQSIDSLTARLLTSSKNITKFLNGKSNESKKFSFFL